MRRTLLILILTGLTMLAITSDAFAQRGGNGGRRSVSNFSRGGDSSYGGDRYYRGYGYWPGNYQRYLGAGISANWYYYYAAPVDFQQSFYSGPGKEQQPATIMVIVPSADAQVWFENTATIQRGTDRLFTAPPLEPGHTFTYTIKARWVEHDQPVERTRQVNIQASQAITVNFDDTAGEILPVPARDR